MSNSKDIIIKLRDENNENRNLYKDSELKIEKETVFIFGKNGTGKSTLSKLIKNQVKNYNVRVFEGFENIIGENRKLNAIVLGEVNNEINKKIEDEEVKKTILEKDKKEIEKKISKNEENPNNLYGEWIKLNSDVKSLNNDVEAYFKKCAKTIKEMDNPRISSINYNYSNFKEDIENSKKLEDDEVKKYKETINTEIKKVENIHYELNLKKLLEESNKLLSNVITPRYVLEEFKNNKEKSDFAQNGMKIHSIGEKCAFCGNEFTEKRDNELKLYFSSEEIDSFKEKLNNKLKEIDQERVKLDNLDVNYNYFYPKYVYKIKNTIDVFNEKRDKLLLLFNDLYKKLDLKMRNLFEKSIDLNTTYLNIDEFIESIKEYNKLANENNSNVLEQDKEEAKSKLRFHYISSYLAHEDYISLKNSLESKNISLEQLNNQKKEYENCIEEKEKMIQEINQNIEELSSKTRNEKILTQNINNKLKTYTNFELEHKTDENSLGFYVIKDSETGELRDIDKLSTGEKNIVAFLYFVEKIEEIDENNLQEKLVVFDDPMNSNDDSMQYVIMEELNKIISKNNNSKSIIMTHNKHFYINITYNKSRNNNSKVDFYHLLSNGKTTVLKHITNANEDFKTSYESLWNELIFLYSQNNISDSMLLNPIRRILETFTKFNVINIKSGIYDKVSGANRLFNINSHSIDDYEAELNGLNREQIIELLKKCFEVVGAVDHFKKYFEDKLKIK